jgi:3-oxoacyl-[acyl-carrier-protein] synthase-1
LPAGIVDTVISTVSEQFGIAPSAIRALPCGHASGLMAMQAAAEAISSSEANVFLVAGVDSYHDPDTLHALDETGALMSAHHRNGFSPGEAAGACVLASRSAAHGAGLPILATVTAAATSVERHTIRSSTVCIGEGLTTAFRGAISRLHLPQQAITDTYCDLNGQRYRTEELVYTLLRVQEAFVDAHDYRCPADCWGDVGAASGPLFAALAIVASQRGYSNGPYPALWAGSESGHRTVALLTTTPRHRATSI